MKQRETCEHLPLVRRMSLDYKIDSPELPRTLVTGLGIAVPPPIQRLQLFTGAVFLYDTPLSLRQSRPLPVHQEGRDLDPVV